MISEPSFGVSHDFLKFVDDHSRFSWMYAINFKSEVFSKFKYWLDTEETVYETKLKSLHLGQKLTELHSLNGL